MLHIPEFKVWQVWRGVGGMGGVAGQTHLIFCLSDQEDNFRIDRALALALPKQIASQITIKKYPNFQPSKLLNNFPN